MLEREGVLQVGRKQSTEHFLQSHKEDGFNLWSESEVAQLCLTLCDHMDCSLPGSSIHGIFQARVLEWIAISFSSGSSQPRGSNIAGSLGLPHCREMLYCLSHQGSPRRWIVYGWEKERKSVFFLLLGKTSPSYYFC